MTETISTARPYDGEDIAVWPDGIYVEFHELWGGGWEWKGDDYEVVRWNDYARMRAIGLAKLADEYDPG